MLIKILLLFLPWQLRRIILQRIYGYKIHPTARVGMSFVYPKHLVMKAGASIGHFVAGIHLDRIEMGENSSIGRGCWITGFPTGTDSQHFAYRKERKCELVIGKDSAITKNHHLDCTDYIHVGNFTTIAGYQSQFLTHSIDVHENRQDCHPIEIGDYCFVSTGVKVLGGSRLPSHSVLAAGAVLTRMFDDEWTIYGGVPAKKIKDIAPDAKYFVRKEGYVW